MYRLEVFLEEARPAATDAFPQARQMLEGVNTMMRRYPGCLRIEVLLEGARIFACDGEGARIAI